MTGVDTNGPEMEWQKSAVYRPSSGDTHITEGGGVPSPPDALTKDPGKLQEGVIFQVGTDWQCCCVSAKHLTTCCKDEPKVEARERWLTVPQHHQLRERESQRVHVQRTYIGESQERVRQPSYKSTRRLRGNSSQPARETVCGKEEAD